MYDSGISNLSSTSALKRQISTVRAQIDESGKRLASGHKNAGDLARTGSTNTVLSIDKELQLLGRYEQTSAVLKTSLNSQQLGLQKIRDTTFELSNNVLAALNGQAISAVRTQAANANKVLEVAVSTLNQSISGKSLFSGAAVDRAALVDATTIIEDVEALLNAAPDAATGLASVDFYFNDPAGGFATASYTGSQVNASDIEIGPGEFVKQDVRADSQAIKDTIQNVSVMAAVSNGAFGASPADQKILLNDSTARMLKSNDDLIKLQQTIGQREEQVENSEADKSASRTSLELLRTEFTNVDLFSESAFFQELQTQLETSYKVTVRLSSLSLSNFM